MGQSILVLTQNLTEAEKYFSKNIEKFENRQVNIFNNPDIVTNSPKAHVIKIEKIRQYIQQLTTKPTYLKQKYLVFFNFHKANIYAQNAFLKTLEEGRSSVFLHATTTAGLLDTTLSRVETVKLENFKVENKEIQDILKTIIEGEKLGDISNLIKTFDQEEILNNLEIYMFSSENKNRKAINKLYLFKKRRLDTNLNFELQLTNIIMDLLN